MGVNKRAGSREVFFLLLTSAPAACPPPCPIHLSRESREIDLGGGGCGEAELSWVGGLTEGALGGGSAVDRKNKA